MTRQALFLIGLTAAMTAAANLLMREGILRAGGISFGGETLFRDLIRLARQPLLDIGVVLYGMASLVWFRVISTEDLSTSYPMLVATTFLFVTSGSILLFNEHLSLGKIIGMALIVLGIIFVSSS